MRRYLVIVISIVFTHQLGQAKCQYSESDQDQITAQLEAKLKCEDDQRKTSNPLQLQVPFYQESLVRNLQLDKSERQMRSL